MRCYTSRRATERGFRSTIERRVSRFEPGHVRVFVFDCEFSDRCTDPRSFSSALFPLSLVSLLFLSFPVRLLLRASSPCSCSYLSLSTVPGSFLGTAPLLLSGVTAPTDSGWSLAGTLVHSGGQRSDGSRRATETPESRPVSWLPGGSRLHRSCAGAAILHSSGSMTVVHELSRVSWLCAVILLSLALSVFGALACMIVLSVSFPPSHPPPLSLSLLILRAHSYLGVCPPLL